MRIPTVGLRATVIFMILGAVGCASKSVRTDLGDVREGMDKARVLELAGNPKRTFHARGGDHWVYVFFEGERELLRQIDFRDGVVVRVNPETARSGFTDRLEHAESMDEYEKAVKAQRQQNSGFKDVPDDGKL